MAGVRVDGLREIVRSMERAGVSVDDLKEAWAPIGAEVTKKAKVIAPKGKSLKASNSIRPSRRKNGVIVSAGRATVPYLRYISWNNWSHYPSPHPLKWIERAAASTDIEGMVEDGIDQALRKSGLL